jgi:hypothetical protein
MAPHEHFAWVCFHRPWEERTAGELGIARAPPPRAISSGKHESETERRQANPTARVVAPVGHAADALRPFCHAPAAAAVSRPRADAPNDSEREIGIAERPGSAGPSRRPLVVGELPSCHHSATVAAHCSFFDAGPVPRPLKSLT